MAGGLGAGSRRATASMVTGSSATADIGSFHHDRARLIDSVGREAQRVVDTYDRRREAEAIADGARTAVAATAAVGAGALGLGALVSLAATTAAADVTGIVHGGRDGRSGVPHHSGEAPQGQGRDSRQDLIAHRATFAARSAPSSSARRTCSAHRFADAIGPYTRFVRAERERWETHRSSLDGAPEPHQPAAAPAGRLAVPAPLPLPRASHR